MAYYDIEIHHVRDLQSWEVAGRIDLYPAYQRRGVWTDDKRSSLIDSLARGLPLGALVLFSYKKDGLDHFEVIDGKQRVTTLLAYVASQFTPTGDDKLTGAGVGVEDLPSDDEGLDELDPIKLGEDRARVVRGKKFKDLPSVTREQLLDATIPAFVVRARERRLAIQVFVRMNRDLYALSQQEIRNAFYLRSAFLECVREIIEKEPPFKKAPMYFLHRGVFARQTIERMGDVQFVSELLCLALAHGQAMERREGLDERYEEYLTPLAIKMKTLGAARVELIKATRTLEAILPGKLAQHNFTNAGGGVQHDYYALMGALLKYSVAAPKLKLHRNALQDGISEFRRRAALRVQDIKQGRLEAPAHLPALVENYARTFTSQQPNSRDRRNERIGIWVTLFKEIAGPASRRESFGATERALIWLNSKDKICGRCLDPKPVAYSNFDAGHIIDAAHGGETVVSNGRVEHRRCNRGGSARTGTR
jgi:hypothetical protein